MSMKSTRGRRLLAISETCLAIIAGGLAILTCFWRDWIEGLTGWDPDHHNGSFEIVIIVGLALVSVACAIAGRYSWRRLAVSPHPSSS
jgi:hypothetical protein